ncbi:MAG TPA: phosphotransferase family protein [bacterium]|nr:phosphotransferase family protein [bacterium]
MTQGSAPGFHELIEMRPDERVDADRVGAFLEGRIPGAYGTPEVLQFEGGKANLTYLLRYRSEDGGALEYVLRRPPLGPVAPKSHDMSREYKVLSRLYRAYPLAPRAFVYSEDAAVVGAPFLVMERRRGIVIRDELPERFRGQPELCRRMGEMIVDAMADLHAVNPESVALGDLGRPEGFVERQVRGWAQRWEAAKTEDVPALDRLTAWLTGSVPPAPRVSLVHNDFKLDNMMVDADDPGCPVAVFDWDMCTLGDPLIDLGTLLGYWTEPRDSEARKAFALMPTEEPGFPTRAEVAQRYAERHGLDVSHIRWYEVFGLWKTAVVVQQIYVRLHRGQTQDERFRSYGRRVYSLVESATELAGL